MSRAEHLRQTWAAYTSGEITLEEYRRRINEQAKPPIVETPGKGYPPLFNTESVPDKILRLLSDGQWHSELDLRPLLTGARQSVAAKVRYLRGRGFTLKEREATRGKEYRLVHAFTNQ